MEFHHTRFEDLQKKLEQESNLTLEQIISYLLRIAGVLIIDDEIKDHAEQILKEDDPRQHLLGILRNLEDSDYYE